MASRSRDVKAAGRDAESARNRRCENTVELRRANKADQLLKRRQVEDEPEASNFAVPTTATASNILALATTGNHTTNTAASKAADVPTEADIPTVAQFIHSADPKVQFEMTQKARKILSKAKQPPVDAFLRAELVPKFVEFLDRHEYPELQYEAAWVLTNIGSGESHQTLAVVQAGAVPPLVRLLSSPSVEVQEQAVWAVGNVAGDCATLRDLVLAHGILPYLLQILHTTAKLSLKRTAAWVLSNLCRGKDPQPNFEVLQYALPTLCALINDTDTETVTDSLWALSYLTDGENYKIQAVINSGCVRRLVELLTHNSTGVQLPAIRAVGNIVTGTDVQTQAVVDCGALLHFAALMCAAKDSIRKEACWAVSNVTAGTQLQIQAVIDSNLVPPLLQCLNADFKIKREAAWAVANYTTGGSPTQLAYLVQQGCIPPLVGMLAVKEVKILLVVLDALAHILDMGQSVPSASGNNPCADYVEEAGGIDAIEELQEHENDEVYQKALKLIETYFMDSEGRGEGEGGNGSGGGGCSGDVAAPQAQGNAYSFAVVPVITPQAVGFSF